MDQGHGGAIRFARTINPALKIVPIIFATQAGRHRTDINPLHGGVHYLANYYGLQAVDVNAAFVARFGSDFADIPGAYQDPAHYQRPIFTTLAAEVIADTAARYLLENKKPGPLPPKICTSDYAASGVISQQDATELAQIPFKNYLYDVSTFDLASGHLSFEIDGGTILAAQYVCTDDASRLYVESNGKWFQSQTLQPGMVESKYKFLLSMLNFDLPTVEGINRITMTALKPDGAGLEPMPQVGTKPPVREEKRLPFVAIMHTGTLISIKATRADAGKTVPEPAL